MLLLSITAALPFFHAVRAEGGGEERGAVAELWPCEGYRRSGVAFREFGRRRGRRGGVEVRGAGGGRVGGGGVENVFCEVEAGAGEPLGEGGHGGVGFDELGEVKYGC